MREIKAQTITEAVKNLCIKACYHLPNDVYEAFHHLKETEQSDSAKIILDDLIQNADIARQGEFPICQDTGMAILFVEIGQEVHILGNLEEALHEGVRQGYVDGYLRKSVVAEPLFERINTRDNTPAFIHYSIVQGDKIKIRMAPKGAGSENKSLLKMLVPADGTERVKSVVLEAVKKAGPNSCPPMVIGVGLGGTMEICAKNAKKACMRDINTENPDKRYAELEKELLALVNKTGIGAQGFGGTSTAIRVHIEWSPTHIASLPVAVNINCHAARHAEIIL